MPVWSSSAQVLVPQVWNSRSVFKNLVRHVLSLSNNFTLGWKLFFPCSVSFLLVSVFHFGPDNSLAVGLYRRHCWRFGSAEKWVFLCVDGFAQFVSAHALCPCAVFSRPSLSTVSSSSLRVCMMCGRALVADATFMWVGR